MNLKQENNNLMNKRRNSNSIENFNGEFAALLENIKSTYLIE